ncbi:AI-2E family transporter [Kocuria massiliensis]|uniref:AI-2E family transporter n=1 Tax=Kocuria massiliensis TaxID=1926282 RepID=UPI0022B9AF58|nr:AI-2E family transporter [Kocuria massiliensis]
MNGTDRPPRFGLGRLSGLLRSLRSARPDAPSIPWAKPRPRFELPEVEPAPEEGSVPSAARDLDGGRLGAAPVPPEAADTPHDADPGARRVGEAQPVTLVRHPVQFGFLVTVGVGLALMCYYLAVNVGALGGWITGAMFIALGLDPIVRWFERRGLPRLAGVIVVLLGFAGLIVLMATVVIPTIARQALGFINGFPDTFEDFLNSDFMVEVNEQFGIRDKIDSGAGNFLNHAFSDSGLVGNFLNSLINAGSTIAQVVTGILIVMFLALYFVTSLPSIKAWGVRLAPRSKRPRVAELTEKITSSVGNYVMGQALVAVLNAIYALILMSIVGVPFPLLCAFVVLLLAFIPLVGGVVAGLLVTFIALVQGWQPAVIYAIFYFGYLQIEAYFISPRIMKKAVAVPGAVAVIAVAGGGALWGVLGAIIAIPVAASALLLIREVFITRQDRR